MNRKLFKIVSILVLISMLVVPVSAKSVTTGPFRGIAQIDDPDGKLQLEAVDPSQVTRLDALYQLFLNSIA
jgi:hypothetical protein